MNGLHICDADHYCIYIGVECPAGMVYQQCGPVCPQTCENQECEGGGCAEGCFCPDGMVLSNSECINKTDCQGNLRHSYMYGYCTKFWF